MKFSDNLQRLRALNNLTQAEVADKLDVTRQTVAKWEAGLSLPDLDNAAALAELLCVSLDDLTHYDEAREGLPMPPKNKHLFGIVTVREDGSVALPAPCRALFSLLEGSTLLVLADTNAGNEGIALVPADNIPFLKRFFESEQKEAHEK